MSVDLFESEGKQVVPDALLDAPLFFGVPLMEIKKYSFDILLILFLLTLLI